jgi:putative Mg2+ transporter-C (MgtC) family protein
MVPWWEVTLRLLLASVLGGIIGWEREVRAKPAGFRTHILVSVAAAIYVLAAQQVSLELGEPVEAMRAMAGIAGGVGFLGAGVILRAQGEVRWLTTAAALWADAALGMAAGMGIYYLAVLGSVLVFADLHWLSRLEKRISTRWRKKQPEIPIVDDVEE